MAELILHCDGLEAGLKPHAGGALSHFTDLTGPEPVDLLRRGAAGSDDPLDSAGFPLVPFCNRVRDGRFRFRGREVCLPRNMPGQKHPLHGQGWRSVWHVLEAGDDFAQIAFEHEAGDWPWTYHSRLTVMLRNRGLEVVLACRNLSDEPMPCGLGLHPYYPCDAETVLDTEATEVWTVDDEIMPVEKAPATGRYGLAHRKVCGQGLDNGYEGWSGEAVLRWPRRGRGLRLTSEAPRFQLYSPERGGLIAAEPVTNANAALNHPESEWEELGLWILQPDERVQLTARFEVFDLQDANELP
jgi:aldose 1-epimerase